MSNAPYLIAALAIATPTLLSGAHAKGVPVPIHVTVGHTAALTSLRASPIAGVAFDPKLAAPELALSRFLAVMRHLVPLRGALSPTKWAAVTRADATEILTRFLNACKAGTDVEGGYKISKSDDRDDHRNVIANIVAGDFSTDEGFTPLGAAAVEARKQLAVSEIPYVPWTATAQKNAMRAVSQLAIEMDDVGALVTGAPPAEPTVLGGISHAATETVAWVAGVPVRIAGTVASGAAAIAFSSAGLMVIAGYLVYRAAKS